MYTFRMGRFLFFECSFLFVLERGSFSTTWSNTLRLIQIDIRLLLLLLLLFEAVDFGG